MVSVSQVNQLEDTLAEGRVESKDRNFDAGRPTFAQGIENRLATEAKLRSLYNSNGLKVAAITSDDSKSGRWLGDQNHGSSSVPKKKSFSLYNSRGDRVGTVVSRDAPSPTSTVTRAAEKLLAERVLGGALELQRSTSLPECSDDSEKANANPPVAASMSPTPSKDRMGMTNTDSFTALFSDGKRPKKNFVLFNSKGQKVATLFNSSQPPEHSVLSEAEERLADCTVVGPPRSAVPTLLANERARRLVELPDKALKA